MNRTYTLDAGATLFHADCRDALRALPDNCIDSGVMDPPYALVSIVKRFGSPNAAPAKGNDAYMRASAGFMGKQWDTGECAMDPGFWAEVLRVLKPGAHLVAFGASRGYHRMACAIEDAGFEIRDSLMWLYGTGFPKSRDISRDVDKMMGGVRAKIRYAPRPETSGTIAGSSDTRLWIEAARERGYHETDSTVPATDAAREWEGWGTALKPAFEPICLARKPLSEGTVAANVLRWRTGALNIDACRIGTEGDKLVRPAIQRHDNDVLGKGLGAGTQFEPSGRWPANLIHDGSDEVVGMFPQSSSTTGKRSAKSQAAEVEGTAWLMNNHKSTEYTDGGGSAARFFYSAKASKADRAGSKHPTVKPVALMEWLCALVTPPGGTVLDPFAGSGTTGIAARAKGFNVVLCEREAEYVGDILRRFGHVDSPSIVPEQHTHTHRGRTIGPIGLKR